MILSLNAPGVQAVLDPAQAAEDGATWFDNSEMPDANRPARAGANPLVRCGSLRFAAVSDKMEPL